MNASAKDVTRWISAIKHQHSVTRKLVQHGQALLPLAAFGCACDHALSQRQTPLDIPGRYQKRLWIM